MNNGDIYNIADGKYRVENFGACDILWQKEKNIQ